MKFAAIDIGSNAVRLLLSNVLENGEQRIFKKEALIRIPIRLGEDSFTQNRISDDKRARLIETMKGFRHLIEAYQAVDYMACATSAMREASNGQDIVQAVKTESGIEIEIVAGKREGEIIYSNRFEAKLDKSKSYLYIDVGGGSTELTLFNRNKSVASRSFNIGTVRLLENLVPNERWTEMKKWIKRQVSKYGPVVGIGSGGNINKIFSLSRQKEGKPLKYKKIKDIYEFLNSYSVEERIKILNMRPDRADVIIPAAKIYVSVMKWAKIKRIYVPEIGLSDGMIHVLYEKHNSKESPGPTSASSTEVLA